MAESISRYSFRTVPIGKGAKAANFVEIEHPDSGGRFQLLPLDEAEATYAAMGEALAKARGSESA